MPSEPPRRCFNLAAPTSEPICPSTRFLCASCRATCKLCDRTLPHKAGTPRCEDDIEEAECELFTDAFTAKQKGVKMPAAGYCDAVIGRYNNTASPWGRATHTGRWVTDHHNEFRFHARGGGRPPATAGDEFRATASKLGRHRLILFMGDSNMRYQYLNLARFLQTGGIWPPPTATADGKELGKFSVCHEHTIMSDMSLRRPSAQRLNAQYDMASLFGAPRPPSQKQVGEQFSWKWASFYNQTRSALSEGHHGGSEACECQMFRVGGQLENRFYRLRVDAAAPKGPSHRPVEVRLGFLGMQGNGHASTIPEWAIGWDGMVRAANANCVAGKCTRAPTVLDNAAFVEQRLAPLKPDVVVFGPGPWMKTKGREESTRKFLQAIRNAVGPNGRAIFRTCPRGSLRDLGRRGCSNGGGCDEPVRKLLRDLDWEIFDLFKITEVAHEHVDKSCPGSPQERKARGQEHACSMAYHSVFSDNVHFQCPVYRELNRMFVAGL